MKKLMIAVVSVLLITTSVFAQQRQRMSPEEMAKRQTEQMIEKLSLTDDQKVKVEAINLKYAKIQSEMMQADQGDRQARQGEMRKNREAKDAELKEVLTPEQYELYQQLQEQQRQQRSGGGERRGRN